MPRTAPLSPAARWYRTLLFLYPPDFRHEFGDEMLRDFEDARNDARESGGWPGVLGFVVWITRDLLCTAIVQWARAGAAPIALMAWTLALASASAATQMMVVTTIAQRQITDELGLTLLPWARNLLSIVVLVTCFLLVVAATITFTLWYSSPKHLESHADQRSRGVLS
jgi:hypothetical protein